MKTLRAWTGILAALALCGCAAVGSDLRRPGGVGRLPRDARIGLVEFRQCGAAYLDRLNPDYYGKDTKAVFLLSCTQLGYPKAFHDRLVQRLEELLGKKLVRVRSDKPFSAKEVLRDAEKLGLDYVLGGDLSAMGETAAEAVVSAQLFGLSVADRKVVLHGRIKKSDAKGRMPQVIDAVADELFLKAFIE